MFHPQIQHHRKHVIHSDGLNISIWASVVGHRLRRLCITLKAVAIKKQVDSVIILHTVTVSRCAPKKKKQQKPNNTTNWMNFDIVRLNANFGIVCVFRHKIFITRRLVLGIVWRSSSSHLLAIFHAVSYPNISDTIVFTAQKFDFIWCVFFRFAFCSVRFFAHHFFFFFRLIFSCRSLYLHRLMRTVDVPISFHFAAIISKWNLSFVPTQKTNSPNHRI